MVEEYFIYPEYAVDVINDIIISKNQVLQEFSEMITNPNLKDASYLPDQNYLGQYRDGLTTFVVKADKELIVCIYENNYEMCKDELAALKQMVSRAQELLNKATDIEIVNDDSKLSLS